MEPYLSDSDFTLYQGDVREVLASLPDESVHTVITSPPYWLWGLRDYGTGLWEGGDEGCDHQHPPKEQRKFTNGRGEGVDDEYAGSNLTSWTTRDATVKSGECPKGCGARRVDQQLGLEPTPDEYVANMVAVFREVKRVLRRDGTCWLNIGDSYATTMTSDRHFTQPTGPDGTPATKHPPQFGGMNTAVSGLKPKDLVGIPWRLAFALQADGWYLRSDIIWSKPNPMPESVTDRPTKAHEYIFLLTRSPRYFFDQEAVRETEENGWARRLDVGKQSRGRLGDHTGAYVDGSGSNPTAGRNVRSVWEIATQPYAEAHFATFPEALVERCIKAGTSERGCCPVCGAAWERETDVSYEKSPVHGAGSVVGRHYETGANNFDGAGMPRLNKRVETTGWRPTCDHGHQPVPCVVLDPFMGSGTTPLVARRHGRKTIGIELKPDYCALAARRLQQLSLLV